MRLVPLNIHRHFPTLSVLRRHPSPSRQQFEGLLAIAQAVGIELDVDNSKKLAGSLDRATREGDPYFNKLLRILSTRLENLVRRRSEDNLQNSFCQLWLGNSRIIVMVLRSFRPHHDIFDIDRARARKGSASRFARFVTVTVFVTEPRLCFNTLREGCCLL